MISVDQDKRSGLTLLGFVLGGGGDRKGCFCPRLGGGSGEEAPTRPCFVIFPAFAFSGLVAELSWTLLIDVEGLIEGGLDGSQARTQRRDHLFPFLSFFPGRFSFFLQLYSPLRILDTSLRR